ncbi:MAG TPA: FAD-dependent monooxygenase [Pyrinomonadaceae bacterium]|nr:FAD-dependent monooxygenase [Pyrinomonadaceae bacterium]
MSERTSFDVLIIGAGQAGIPLAHALAKVGKRVGLVERQHVGVCGNRTKAQHR